MQKTSSTKRSTNGNSGAAVFRLIPLKEIKPSPANTRRHFDEKSIADLAESIRQHGVLQPILLRAIAPAKSGGAKFEIIAGERRFRAAKDAGLKEIPAQLRQMDETEALSAQLVENLQRENIHPLDEADGFRRLKDEMHLSVRDIAARVAKDARYVARRLALTHLIEDARDDLRHERITLAHALEICRLAPEVQPQALAACFETRSVLNKKKDGYDYLPDKTRPARHVRHVQEWIVQNVLLNLQRAPFKLDDARLREDGMTCLNCPQRTGHDKTLFADIRDGDRCLNPICYQAKLQRFVQITKADVEARNGKPAVIISAFYGAKAEDGGALSREQYQVIEKKSGRCEHAEAAVFADGNQIGGVKWICRERACKDHLGRTRESHAHSPGGASRPASSEARNQRKQELFDVKVDEIVRKRVMREAIKTFAWPLDRAHLNEAVKEFFRRLPSSDQRTIREVFGWEEQGSGKLRFDGEAVLRALGKLDDNGLAQFLMLCSFAHHGANPDGNRKADQSAVVQLSQARGVNHTLIDAEARAELCPKKYKAAHQAYVDAVKNGKAGKKPVVYERPPKVAQPDAGSNAEKKPA